MTPDLSGYLALPRGQEANQGSVRHCLKGEKSGVRDGAAEAPQEQDDPPYSAISGEQKHKDVWMFCASVG